MRYLTLAILVFILVGCTSYRRASYLVPALHGNETSLIVDAVLCKSATIVSTTQLLLYAGGRTNLYLEPADDRSKYCAPVRTIPKGALLSDIRAMHINLFDSSSCLLQLKVAGETAHVHIDESDIAKLLGFVPEKPASRSWVCRFSLSAPNKSLERTREG